MKLRTALPLALVALAGCGKVSQDASRVLANVGGTKITEQDLAAMARALVKDPKEAEALATDPARKADRQALLEQMAQNRAMLAYGKAEGLEQDPRYQARLEAMQAQVFMQMLAERRVMNGEPAEADLKGLYAKFEAQMKLTGQPMPPYDQALPRLKEIWKQQQQQRLVADFQKEVMSKVHITFAEDALPSQ